MIETFKKLNKLRPNSYIHLIILYIYKHHSGIPLYRLWPQSPAVENLSLSPSDAENA